MEDLRERPRKLIHKELQSQYVDTLTYWDIRGISGNMYTRAPSNCILSQQMLKELIAVS
jgi:hypothetical protein